MKTHTLKQSCLILILLVSFLTFSIMPVKAQDNFREIPVQKVNGKVKKPKLPVCYAEDGPKIKKKNKKKEMRKRFKKKRKRKGKAFNGCPSF